MLVLVTAFLYRSYVATWLYFRCIIVHAIYFTEIKRCWWIIQRRDGVGKVAIFDWNCRLSRKQCKI